ncbi:MAG: helix-hairpin-helix domain-containing protein [Desulfurivibrionaceae bacterium]|jgi:competence protein ComEA
MIKFFLSTLCGCLCWTTIAFAAVDINKATTQELVGLQGIGPAKAQAIVEYRQKNGQFKSTKDLAKVKGIGPKIVEKLGNGITVTK